MNGLTHGEQEYVSDPQTFVFDQVSCNMKLPRSEGNSNASTLLTGYFALQTLCADFFICQLLCPRCNALKTTCENTHKVKVSIKCCREKNKSTSLSLLISSSSSKFSKLYRSLCNIYSQDSCTHVWRGNLYIGSEDPVLCRIQYRISYLHNMHFDP